MVLGAINWAIKTTAVWRPSASGVAVGRAFAIVSHSHFSSDLRKRFRVLDGRLGEFRVASEARAFVSATRQWPQDLRPSGGF